MVIQKFHIISKLFPETLLGTRKPLPLAIALCWWCIAFHSHRCLINDKRLIIHNIITLELTTPPPTTSSHISPNHLQPLQHLLLLHHVASGPGMQNSCVHAFVLKIIFEYRETEKYDNLINIFPLLLDRLNKTSPVWTTPTQTGTLLKGQRSERENHFLYFPQPGISNLCVLHVCLHREETDMLKVTPSF